MLRQTSFASLSSASLVLLCAGLASLAACGDDDPVNGGGGQGNGPSTGGQGGEGGSDTPWPIAPALRNPVDTPDAELAYEALLLMGVNQIGSESTTCSKCHAITSGLLETWKAQTDTAVATCFADPTLPTKEAAEAVIQCARQKASPTSSFYTPKLGIYSAAAKLDWFNFVFSNALDEGGVAEYAEFVNAVDMPKATTHWTQAEFDIVAEWFARGLPFLKDLLPDDPGPGDCVQNITPAVGDHIEAMKTAGWRAENAANDLLMFGCAGAATTLDCLSTYPSASDTTFGTGWEYMPDAKLRVLKTVNYSTSYWTRSSADGRFVGHGGSAGGGSSTIVDLLDDSSIDINAAYDPGFFPDNTGWIFQGAPGGAGICQQSLLVSSPASVSFNEPACTTTDAVGLYQHVGAAPNGGDYWTVDGYFVSDNGGHEATLENPDAYFGGNTVAALTPLIYNGTDYVTKSTEYKSTPYEGDIVMSPSSKLLMGRVSGPSDNQDGFRLRRVDATPNGSGYDVEIPEIGRYCINGGKPGISFDERWAVLHSYVTGEDAVELGFTGPSDPGFTAYANQGAANIYLVDLLTGIVRRVTHMQPGQYALFPHFRSDGWVYFIVRNMDNHEYIVASDAALTLETTP